jgi:hypothetical protein
LWNDFIHEFRKFCFRKAIRRIYRPLMKFCSHSDKRLEKLLTEVCNIAYNKGFKFQKPKIRMISKGISFIRVDRNKNMIVSRMAGFIFKQSETIYIFSRYLNQLSDMELAVLIAHEFGHYIDDQTKRQGHPLFESIRHLDLDGETFADAIAAYLYGKLVFISASDRNNFPYNKSIILRLRLNV